MIKYKIFLLVFILHFISQGQKLNTIKEISSSNFQTKINGKSTKLFTLKNKNGVVVQNNTELKGATRYIGKPSYKKHGASPIKLQAHGDKSEPISFRNIWIREL